VIAVDLAGGAEDVNTPALCRLDRLTSAVDIRRDAAGQAADDAAGDFLSNLADRLEIPVGADRETGLDDIDTHRLEMAGDLQLRGEREGSAGGLFAIAQGFVENSDRFHDRSLSGHRIGVTGDIGCIRQTSDNSPDARTKNPRDACRR